MQSKGAGSCASSAFLRAVAGAQLIKPGDDSKINCEVLLDGEKLRVAAKKGPFSKEIIWIKTQ